jgi:hypothetical protein
MTRRKRRLTQADLRTMGASPGRLATRYSPEGRAEVRQLTADADRTPLFLPRGSNKRSVTSEGG